MTGEPAPLVVRRFGLSSPEFQNFATDKWKLLFLASLAIVIYVPAAFLTDVPFAVVASAMGGALPILWLTAPAHVALDSAAVSTVKDRLERSRFVPDFRKERWTPPLPKWLRWRDAVVILERSGTGWRARGPINFLKILSTDLTYRTATRPN